MVYLKEANPSRGQGYRDKVRCEALERKGYMVESLDDKHVEELAKEQRHCRTNFSDIRKMVKKMKDVWSIDGNPRYDVIILDYFFSPTGWTNTRWTTKFFTETLPGFLEHKLLKKNGSIWLPNCPYVDEMVTAHTSHLSNYYDWFAIKRPTNNPLYEATDDVNHLLMQCPDRLTNENQIVSLTNAGGPFLLFKPKRDYLEKIN